MKVAIIGGGGIGKTAVTQLLEKDFGAEIITLTDAQNKEISNTTMTKESIPYTLIDTTEEFYTPPPTRAERRKKRPKKRNRRY